MPWDSGPKSFVPLSLKNERSQLSVIQDNKGVGFTKQWKMQKEQEKSAGRFELCVAQKQFSDRGDLESHSAHFLIAN